MATITTDNGTFEADTIESATKLAKRAEREARKADAERAKLRETAYTLAAEKGFRILCNLLEPGEMPRAWKLYRPGDKWANSLFASVECDYDGFTKETTFTTESAGDGLSRVTVGHYGWDMVGAVCGGSGFTICYFLRDRTTGEVECRALGCYRGVPATERVPTVKPEHFTRETEDSAV